MEDMNHLSVAEKRVLLESNDSKFKV